MSNEPFAAAVGRALARAREAWPEVRLSDETFAAELERACRGDDPAGALAALRVEELFLAQAAGTGDPAALRSFEAAYLSKIAPAIASLGDAAFIAEVAQRLRESLLVTRPDRAPKIGSYSGRGELLRWVRAAAVRTALNLRKEKNQPALDSPELDELPLAGDDPQLEGMKKLYGERFRLALREAVASLPAQTRIELRQYYFEGLGLDELGALYRLAPSSISRRLAKARELLSQRTRETLSAHLGVAEDEIESILRLIHSRLDVSRSAFEGG